MRVLFDDSSTTSNNVKWLQERATGPARGQGSQNAVKHRVELFAKVFGQESHDQVTVLLIDPHFPFAVVESVQSADVLCDRTSPRDRKRYEQRVQPPIIESFPDVFAGRQHHTLIVARDRRQFGGDGVLFLLASASPQSDQVTYPPYQPPGEL